MRRIHGRNRRNPRLHQGEIIHQVELNLWETWSNFGRDPGCTPHDESDALWFETPIPVLPYNTVLKFQVENNAEERIDRLVDGYEERNVPQLWIVHPSSRPNDLAKRLVKRGLQEVEIAPCMARSLESLPEPPPIPEGVEIREAIEEVDLISCRVALGRAGGTSPAIKEDDRTF